MLGSMIAKLLDICQNKVKEFSGNKITIGIIQVNTVKMILKTSLSLYRMELLFRHQKLNPLFHFKKNIMTAE